MKAKVVKVKKERKCKLASGLRTTKQVLIKIISSVTGCNMPHKMEHAGVAHASYSGRPSRGGRTFTNNP